MNIQGTLLLVEDNPDDELLTKRALARNNIVNEVVVAHDGAEALRLLFGSDDETPAEAAGPVQPNLILLDLKLPKFDGLEVLRRIRSHDVTRHVPVVVLTSSDEERDLIRSYDLGANSYVRKPVDFVEFAEAVRILGLYWLLLNRAPPATQK